MAFHDDIKSKHLSNFVLVTIGDDICISTQKITFDNKYYKPILLNIPSISESLDIEQRKYKISSVSLSISDYEVDGERFSDNLNTLMNKEVNIYYASQSCSNLDDCYKAGTYIVRSFSQDEDKVTLNCEDLSQDKLHRDLPFDTISDEINSADKKRKPQLIPIVFGEVDNSPSVYKKTTGEEIAINVANGIGGNYEVIFDSIDVDFANEIPLRLYDKGANNYLIVHKEQQWDLNELSDSGQDPFDDTHHNIDFIYEVTGGRCYIISKVDSKKNTGDYYDRNLPYDDLVQCEFIPPVKEIHVTDKDEFDFINTNISTDIDGFFSFSGVLKSEFSFENAQYDEFNVKILYEQPSEFDSPAIKIKGFLEVQGSVINTGGVGGNLLESDLEIGTFNDNKIHGITTQEALEGWYVLEHDAEYETPNSNSNTFNYINFKVKNRGLVPSITLGLHTEDIDFRYWFNKRIENETFYAHVIGRGDAEPSSQDIYTEILSELDFDEELINTVSNDIELGQYAFTIDKKINSKKLIEELSQSTPLYPYFKDGQFRVKSIKWKDSEGSGYKFSDVFPSKRIKAEDVINYKYDRTKVEKVYTKVNVKYHYDYGLKDFTKETGDITPNESGDSMSEYTNETFGGGFDQEFVFESKYIRYEETATNLAKYLAGLHANQHNIINLTLPLNYLTFELGDIVGFDKLIQDRKMFGEDYTKMEVRNSQEILPIFFVNKIKKSLDKVEISLYQLHNFSDNSYVEEEIPEEPDIVFGCLDDQAINFNSLANTSQDVGNFGACFFPIEIVPPEIISPVNNHVIPIEIDEIIDEPETILSANRVVRIVLWSEGTIRIYFHPDDNLFNENITSLQQGDSININFSYEEETDIQEILDLINDSGVHEVYGLTYSSTVNILTLYSNTFTFTGDSSANFYFSANDLNVVISTMPSEPIQEEVNPSLNIIWNRSNNIHEYIPELDVNTINDAYYKVFIYSQTGSLIYQSTIIQENEVEDFQFNHIINLGQIGLPQNESVQVVIQAINSSMYNNQSIYSNSPTTEFTLIWGEDDEETDTTIIGGDVNLDGFINVVDIIALINHILGVAVLNEEMLLEADISEDGYVNVTDIVQIVNKILDQ